jgi:hypothetical protein
MASCNINDLLENGKCFAALPPSILSAASLQLWCDISDNIGPTPPGEVGGLWNPEVGAPIFNPAVGAPIDNPDV